MISKHNTCVVSDFTVFLPVSIEFQPVTYDAMESSKRIFRLRDENVGERVIGCFGSEKDIDAYTYGFFLGKDAEKRLVFAFIHREEPCLETVAKAELRNGYTIYQAFHSDIRRGTRTLNRISAKKFAERWVRLNPDRFEKENPKRRDDIARLQSWETRRSSSTNF